MSEIKYVDSVALKTFWEYAKTEITSMATAEAKKQIIDLVYPVGSIYMSFENKNPQDIFGGCWNPIEGKFLLAADSTYISGDIGGNNEVILKQTDIPKFTGTLRLGYEDRGLIADETSTGNKLTKGVFSASGSPYTARFALDPNTGYTLKRYQAADFSLGYDSKSETPQTAINIMPEYIAVYMWRRMKDNTTTFVLDQSKLDDTTQILA